MKHKHMHKKHPLSSLKNMHNDFEKKSLAQKPQIAGTKPQF